MKRLQSKYFFAFVFLLLSSSCQEYSQSFEVVRKTSISAKINDEDWQANDYLIRDLGQVVYYSDASDTEGDIFNRISIIGYSKGNSIERLEITLDVLDASNIVGTYNTVYDENGGINNIEWTESETSAGFFPFYSLCNASANTEFIVDRQNEKENLISGTFKTTLCERTSSADTVQISEGIFRDLDYEGQ